MTRKCVLCKETNYKNSYSFFSAPKDPETRKKWTQAMAIKNYVVSDDTFVCSKHFSPDDIITHWISGVPPHVVTIKYKKCRLRPGAIPSTSCESMNNLLNNQDDEYEEFEVNRGSGSTIMRTPFFAGNADKETFMIPRQDPLMDHCPDSPESQYANAKEAIVVYKHGNMFSVAGVADENNSVITNNLCHMENLDEEQAELRIIDIGKTEQLEYREESEIMYVDGGNCEQIDCIEEIELVHETKASVIQCETAKTQVSTAEETSTDMWESVSNDNPTRNNNRGFKNFTKNSAIYYSDDEAVETPDPLDIRSNEDLKTVWKAMLFEDLMDMYTEVQLPSGWSSMVTSKGHSTTVVYAYMSMTKNGVPYVEKQVFLKSDMKLRCGAANKEINPRMHNLVRDGRNRTVYTLSDVEELVEEFDQRIICEGCAGEKTRSEDIGTTMAYRDVSGKWRHLECPIIVNNGSTRCSKCSTLDSSLTRSRTRRHNSEAQNFATAIMKKEKTIRVLQRLLRKMNKRNQKFETMRNSVDEKLKTPTTETQKLFMETLETREMPKIQKIMVEECLRASATDTEKIKYSETWVFLCLLLYIESPRMYRYMLLNEYMALPSMKIIRRYLHQIKTDTQFYNLFQRAIEPYQPTDRDNVKEPT